MLGGFGSTGNSGALHNADMIKAGFIGAVVGLVLVIAAFAYAGGTSIPARYLRVCESQGMVEGCTPRVNRSLSLTLLFGLVEDTAQPFGQPTTTAGWVIVKRGLKVLSSRIYPAPNSETPCMTYDCGLARAWGGTYQGVSGNDLMDLTRVFNELPYQIGEPALAGPVSTYYRLTGYPVVLQVKRLKLINLSGAPVVEARVRVGWLN